MRLGPHDGAKESELGYEVTLLRFDLGPLDCASEHGVEGGEGSVQRGGRQILQLGGRGSCRLREGLTLGQLCIVAHSL
jgi:hypothetical protein